MIRRAAICAVLTALGAGLTYGPGVAAGAPELAGEAPHARPWGPAPASITWRRPPDRLARVAPGGWVHVAAGSSDLDVWQGAYRLRQLEAPGGLVFRRRVAGRWVTRARYLRASRVLYSVGRARLVVYSWVG